jgi:hypothetical protein
MVFKRNMNVYFGTIVISLDVAKEITKSGVSMERHSNGEEKRS